MSTTLRYRAEHVLAGGPGTFSKSWLRFPQGIGPMALVSGEGCHVTGDDERMYLDTVSALGAVVLGHAHSTVTAAVQRQAALGTSFSMLHPLEVEVAEQLCAMLPCADMVRFCKNGTDATGMAVRLARVITGKRHAIFAGYHGGGCDSYGITTDKAAGILPQIAPYNHQVTWDTIGELPKHIWDDLACVMTEVPALPWDTPARVYQTSLRLLQGLAHASDALFVLDEVVTFPRCASGGAQVLYGVTPDLACVSKGIANGMPLAALVGKRQYMERLNVGDIFASWTFAGETTALAACQATLDCIRTGEALATIYTQGQALGDGLQILFVAHNLPAQVYGHPWRIAVRWQDTVGATAVELRTLWLAEMLRRGILLNTGVVFPMSCWGDQEVSLLLTAAQEVCVLMQAVLELGAVQMALPCPVIEDVLAVRA